LGNCLNEHEAKIVVRFRVVRAKPNGFAERGRDVFALRARASEQPAEQIVRFRSVLIREIRAIRGCGCGCG
jgi:hypothetical protein